ncbi:MAG: MFS transporter [Solirubrobacteraceae bacterium]
MAKRPTAPEDHAGLSRALVALLAITSGAAVANIYYVQPLLNLVTRAFAVSDGTAGLLVTAAQVGYVAGLVLLVPLGDLLERRRLIGVVLAAGSAALAACALAPGFWVLTGALIAVGATAVVAQIVVPLAATLAAPADRGRVVGTVMSGLLIGILLSRTLSGLVAQLGGWRLVFAVAAAGMLILAITVSLLLPRLQPAEPMRYRAALRSIFTLIIDEPVLRQRMVFGGLGLCGFTILWTSIAFLLSHAPYHYDTAVIGLFGLAGAAGASISPVAGRLADRGHGRLAINVFLLAVLASWALLAFGHSSLVALIIGIVVLDLGIQGAHISNQSAIYRLHATARSRLTTAYMVSAFIGGIVGSLLSANIYNAAGWSAVCLTGAGVAATAVAYSAATRRLAVPPQ